MSIKSPQHPDTHLPICLSAGRISARQVCGCGDWPQQFDDLRHTAGVMRTRTYLILWTALAISVVLIVALSSCASEGEALPTPLDSTAVFF